MTKDNTHNATKEYILSKKNIIHPRIKL